MRLEVGAIRYVVSSSNSDKRVTIFIFSELHWHTASEVSQMSLNIGDAVFNFVLAVGLCHQGQIPSERIGVYTRHADLITCQGSVQVTAVNQLGQNFVGTAVCTLAFLCDHDELMCRDPECRRFMVLPRRSSSLPTGNQRD